MAIINCPECNEKISSSVNHCIHCGAKIAVCPECEQIYASHPEKCSSCGYVFKSDASSDANAQKAQEKLTAPELKRKWKSENFFNVIMAYSNNILSVIGLAVMLFVSIKVVLFASNMSAFNAISTYNEALETIKSGFIVAAIFFILSGIADEIKLTLTGSMLATWAGLKGISLIEVIKNTFAADYSKTVEKEKAKNYKDWRDVVDSAFLSNDYLSKNKQILRIAIAIILYTVASIFLAVFMWHNIEIFTDSEALKQLGLSAEGWSFSMIENWWQLIVFVALRIVIGIYKAISGAPIKQRKIEWLEKTIPEAKEKGIKNAIVDDD